MVLALPVGIHRLTKSSNEVFATDEGVVDGTRGRTSTGGFLVRGGSTTSAGSGAASERGAGGGSGSKPG